MNESLERIERRLGSATEMHEIFGAMRAMAAVRLQEAQGALAGTRAYADTLGTALAEVLALVPPAPPPDSSRPVLVVFAPEHGFVGALAERLADRAAERADAALVVVGDRGADVMEQRGMPVRERLSLGAHVQAGPAIVRALSATLERLTVVEGADAVELVFPRYAGGGRIELVERRLIPLEPGTLPAVPSAPLVNLPVPDLVEAVLAQWVLGELVHAVVETLASENGARLVAMDAARTSVESKLEELRGAYRSARQEAITSEIADVVGGVLAQDPP